MSRITLAESQELHRQLVTELQAGYAEREDAQEKVNAAIRYLRAVERKCQNISQRLANNDQLMLSLTGKGVASE